MLIVRRIKDTGPEGSQYAVESKSVRDEKQADLQAKRWWDFAKHTVGIAIISSTGTTVTTYTREGLDPKRIPDGWAEWKPPPTRIRDSASVEKPHLEPTDLFDEEPEEPAPARSLDTVAFCGCCRNPKPTEKERDRTPSGRMADGRCPACGSRLPRMKQIEIMRMYSAYQRSLDAPPGSGDRS